MKPKVVILTVPHGTSHVRLANTLRRALLEREPALNVEVIDALEHCAPWFRAYYNSYTLPLRYFPALWDWIENIQHKSSSTGPAWLYRRAGQPLFRFLRALRPDVTIATEVGVCELASMAKREGGLHFDLVGATTGLDVDRAWAQREVDLYLVAPGEPAAALEAAGVPGAKIVQCGVPIDPAFSPQEDRERLRARLGLACHVPLLLVLFGGTGFGKPVQILSELRKVNCPLSAVFIAGRNQRLKREIQSLSQGQALYRVLGWVENMHDWMAAADLAVGKPGASTLLEAINTGLPFLAVDPLPGNERRACDWIEQSSVGYWVRRPADLASAIARLLANPGELDRLRANTRALARPQAAREAAEAILKRMAQRAATSR